MTRPEGTPPSVVLASGEGCTTKQELNPTSQEIDK